MWGGILVVALVAAVLRSSPWFPVPPVASVVYVGALVGGILVASRESQRLRLPMGALKWFWALIGYALVLAVVLMDVGQLSSLVLLLLLGTFCTSAYSRRWPDSGLTEKDIGTVYWTLTTTIGLSLLLGASGRPEAFGYFSNLSGIYANVNYLGLACVIVLPISVSRILALRGSQLAGAWIVTAVCLVALAWTKSRGSLVAALVGGCIVLLAGLRWSDTRRRSSPLLVIGVLTALIAAPLIPTLLSRSDRATDFSSGRFEIWSQLLGDVSGFGRGLYAVTETIALPGGASITLEAHNLALQVLVGLGVVGLALLLGFLVTVLVGSFRQRPGIGVAGAAIGILVYELTESSLFGVGGPVTLASWLVLFATAASAARARNALREPDAMNWGALRVPVWVNTRQSASSGLGESAWVGRSASRPRTWADPAMRT